MATNLTVAQGSDFAVRWPIVNPDRTPVDCTGGTVKAQVRSKVTDTAVLHEWSTSTGTAVADEDGVTLLVPAATSSGWTWSTGVYDVELTLAGTVVRVAQGRVSVDPEVTRG